MTESARLIVRYPLDAWPDMGAGRMTYPCSEEGPRVPRCKQYVCWPVFTLLGAGPGASVVGRNEGIN